MRKKVKVTKKLAAAGLAAILACQVMGCGTGEKPTKDVSDEKVSEVKSQEYIKKGGIESGGFFQFYFRNRRNGANGRNVQRI